MQKFFRIGVCGCSLLLVCCTLVVAEAGDEFERAPINYRSHVPQNSVSRLQAKLDSGDQVLPHDAEFGYLPALLSALEVPQESQMLVYSKTSLQLRRISPRTPRAIYFNDDVYVGYCQAGDVLELSVADADLGTVFYTLDQEQAERPAFHRAVDNCLICHSSSRTEGVPGHLVRSLYVDRSGQPLYSAGSRTVDHTTPIKERWGGWYVTGQHGSETHLGNLIVETRTVPDPVDNSAGHNVMQLQDRINVARYLQPHSDIVALMILEHQTLVHNRITKASFAARQAMHYEDTMNKALDQPTGTPLESTARRIASASDDLVEALLLVDEAPLLAPIEGTSGYSTTFSARGPRDSAGRSLRDLDLQTRMFRFPCSFLVYSESFDGLPQRVRDYVWQQMWQVLTGENTSEKFAHLSSDDRRAILEILHETKARLPEYWKP